MNLDIMPCIKYTTKVKSQEKYTYVLIVITKATKKPHNIYLRATDCNSAHFRPNF